MMKQGGLGGVDNFEKLLITKKEWGELSCRPGFETYCLYQSPFFYQLLKEPFRIVDSQVF